MPRLPEPSQTANHAWFATRAGCRLLDSEAPAAHAALGERPGQAWLWLAPVALGTEPSGGLHLVGGAGGWHGTIHCGWPLPLASDSLGTVLVQHVGDARSATVMVEECARVLVPGGRLWIFGLNPLAPYRWHWQGSGLPANEPMVWRRRLRAAGLVPDAVSQGLGPRWRIEGDSAPQHGAGLRAAYLLRAEKRHRPLTPMRSRTPLRIGGGVPAA